MATISQMAWMIRTGLAWEDPTVEGLYYTSTKTYSWVVPYLTADGSVGGGHYEEVTG